MDNLIIELLGVSLCIYYYKNLPETNFNLRPHKNKKIKKVKLPPELQAKFNEAEFRGIASKEIKDAVNEFLEVLTNNFPREILTNFYNNIHDMQIHMTDYKLKNIFHKIEFNGSFNAKTNTIKLNKNEQNYEAIFHELFHMASTVSLDNDIYSGFRQHKTYNSKDDIGVGINEGYTQALTERYFGHIEGIKYSYPFETFIACLIEEIIGEDKMAKYYFNANLYGLIDELSQYNLPNNVMKFIYNLDFLNKIPTLPNMGVLEQDYIIKSIKQIIDFLFYTYERKIKKQFNKGLISENEYIRNLEIYAINLKTIYYSKSYRYVIDNNITFVGNLPTLNTQINVSSLDESFTIQKKK